MSRPTLTIIAGANGAGKSTLAAGSPGTFGAIPLLDPDAFANTIRSSGTGINRMHEPVKGTFLGPDQAPRYLRSPFRAFPHISGRFGLHGRNNCVQAGKSEMPFRSPSASP